MNEYLTTTLSVCASCGRLVPARVHLRADGVWFHKECPDHGPEETRVHGDVEAYRRLGQYHRVASKPLAFSTTYQGCPYSCGLCPEHEQHVCLPILEITDHCDLDCPICLVRNRGTFHRTRAEVARCLDGLIQSEGQIDVLNLSGGEPTLHPSFREIIEECVARREIVRVSVSTNGLRLARDPDLLRFLAERRVIISLQFDGLNDGIYQALRGRPLLDLKRRLIEACAAMDAPMSLTATVASGVNAPAAQISDPAAANDPGRLRRSEGQAAAASQPLREIADLLFQYDHILSVMFQPAAYAGHAAELPRPSGAVTIPDVIAGLRGAGGGTVSPSDFSPLPCSHPACFALAFYLKVEGNRFTPINQLVSTERYLRLIQNRAIFGTDAESFRHVTDAVYDLWSGAAFPKLPTQPARELGPRSSVSAERRHLEEGQESAALCRDAATGPFTPREQLRKEQRVAPDTSCGEAETPCACSQFATEGALRTIKRLLTSATAQGGYSPQKAWQAGERSVKSIFVHQFMDRHTFDLARARKCCQVYPQPDGRLMPACVYNCLKRP